MTTTTHEETKTTIKFAPKPKGKPIIGNLNILKPDPLLGLYNLWKEYGDFVHLKALNRQIYAVSHPAFIHELFVTGKFEFLKTSARPKNNGLELLLGNGLVTNPEYDHWLPQRRMMQPMFHHKRILTMGDKMTAAGEAMLSRWAEKYPSGTMIDLHEEMMAVTLDIINRTMFSATDALEKAGEVGPAITVTAEFVSERSRRALRVPLSWPTPGNRNFKEALATLDGMIEEIIMRRRQSDEQYDDLLDMLLEARDEETGLGMSEQQLRDEVKTIYAAGHETTSNALSWAWYLLAQNSTILQQLQSELDEVLDGRLPTFPDLNQLPYTQMVFKEAIRLLPPVPLVPRYAPTETTLNGYQILPKSLIVPSVYNIHRHPDFWEKPETFWPEHFTPEREKERAKYAYMPFGAGPRICIGSNFAHMEGTLLLAMMAQKYTLTLVAEYPVEKEMAVTLRPKDGLKMRLQPR